MDSLLQCVRGFKYGSTFFGSTLIGKHPALTSLSGDSSTYRNYGKSIDLPLGALKKCLHLNNFSHQTERTDNRP